MEEGRVGERIKNTEAPGGKERGFVQGRKGNAGGRAERPGKRRLERGAGPVREIPSCRPLMGTMQRTMRPVCSGFYGERVGPGDQLGFVVIQTRGNGGSDVEWRDTFWRQAGVN